MTPRHNQGLCVVGCCKVGKGGAPELGAEYRGLGVVLQQAGIAIVVAEGQ